MAPRRLLAFVALLAMCSGTGASSQNPSSVVVRVNGKAVTEADVRLAEGELFAQLARLPPDRRSQFVLDYLVDGQLFAEAAEKASLDKEKEFEDRRRYFLRRALRDAYFDSKIRVQVSDDMVRKAFDDQIATLKPIDELHLRQILAGSEAEARDLRLKLVSGSDFANLARQHSRDIGTAQAGGDMGYVLPAQLDPDFAAAVSALTTGDISLPIRTRFGWVIARIEDRRVRPFPKWEDSRDVLRLELLGGQIKTVVEDLRAQSAIVYTNPDDAIGK